MIIINKKFLNYSKGGAVSSELGKMLTDSKGSPISGVKLDPEKAYGKISLLLQKYINDNDEESWLKLTEKINYIYENLDYVLWGLNGETNFCSIILSELGLRKKLIFKLNAVSPNVIDENTHGAGAGYKICTEWPFIAALMRWFHDKLFINYYQMAIGDASTMSTVLSYIYSKKARRKISSETVYEGKSENFYGGWGFYFVRKYLKEHHPKSHKDDPMKGYEDSLSGNYIPPGRSEDRLMVYDLNKIQDNASKGRTIKVPEGVNYKEITLHKAVIGGYPDNKEDLRNYPGAVIINIPKTKMHAQDLLTNAIKNLGIGLYPSECASGKDKNDTSWKYASPNNETPTLKAKLPHSPWVLKMDEKTHLPVRDENGNYIMTKTAGFSGTQTDIIKAVQNQKVFMLHIADSINIINMSHDNDLIAVKVPEGYIWSSLDCVALDLFCARYAFKTIPMVKALKLKEKYKWPTEFVHHVPKAVIKDKNIVSTLGYDSPLFRYDLYNYAQKRGIGELNYYIIGWDSTTLNPLASLNGHLGKVELGKFKELMTHTMYYNPSTIYHHLQLSLLSYAKACDALTGSTVYKEIMDSFDENHDGIISYDEKGRGYENSQFEIMTYTLDVQLKEAYGSIKGPFMRTIMMARYSCKDWNAEKHDFTKERLLVTSGTTAFSLSQSDTSREDLFIKGMMYGRGMWPSWETVLYIQTTGAIYGCQSVKNISLFSLYGLAFQYADKTQNLGIYTGSMEENKSNSEAINRYFEALRKGKEPLGFTLYVPEGYGILEGYKIPNVVETIDPLKVFTAEFNKTWS